MKRFVFYVTRVGHGKYGGVKEFAKIYLVKKNNLECVGETRTWCTASYMGRHGEVNSFLLANKLIPQTWSRDYNGTITSYYKENEKYEIKEI